MITYQFARLRLSSPTMHRFSSRGVAGAATPQYIILSGVDGGCGVEESVPPCAKNAAML